MKRILKSIVSISLCIVMLLTVFPMADITFFASAEVVGSGKCGDNLTWTLDSDGKLTIEGTEEMYNYSGDNNPWAYNTEILEVVITDGVTTIGNYAFAYCDGLTSITIPDSVTSIGRNSFSDCYSLTSITIPDSVMSIGEGAFVCCTGLISITIPDSVTSIGKGVFSHCNSLACITVDDNNPNYLSDDSGVLFNKNKTELIQFPSGKTETSYNVPDSVTSIGDYAFFINKSIASITIPDSVTNIGKEVFSFCSSLTSITIPDSVVSIGERAFFYCDSLKTITIPDGVTSIGDYTFIGCGSLTNITIPDSVTSIGEGVFSYCSGLTSITIPDSITSIGNYAFDSCYSLTNITIPDSVISIGDNAFCGCNSLTSITIPNSVTRIEEMAFFSCDGLTNITFHNPETQIYDSSDTIPAAAVIYGYKGSTAQTYAEKHDREFVLVCDHINRTEHGETPADCINDGATAGVYCEDCNNWISGHEVIEKTGHTDEDDDGICETCGEGNYVAEGVCGDNLTWQLTDKGTLIIEGTGEMYNYSNSQWSDYDSEILDVVISDRVTSIGIHAFYDCNSLTSITIPDDVTSIGEKAFYSCDSLTCITVDDNNPNYSSDEFGVLFNKNKTELIQFPAGSSETSYNIPDSVTSIGDTSFSCCTNLMNITIPDGVTSIGNSAFDGCSALTSITIPNSVISIGDMAFDSCINLTSITIPDSVTRIAMFAFYSCNSLTSIIIPYSVQVIAWGAFCSCNSLTSITFLNPETRIADFSDTIPAATVIYGYKDSTAQEYAEKYDIEFVAIDEPETHTHSYISEITTQPTCDKTGTKTFACSCGDSYTEAVAALGHSFSTDFTVDKEATCSAEGSKSKHCTRSGCSEKTEVTAIAKLAHTYTSKITAQPTCAKEGVKTFTCSCGDSYTEAIAKLAHAYTSKITAQPTCDKEGTKTFTCSCGDSYTESVAALGHSFSTDFTVDKEATCTAEGSKSKHCTRSGCSEKTEVTAIAKLAHTYTSKITAQPTCAKEGVKTFTCVCGNSYTEAIAKLEHKYTSKITTQPTCGKEGVKTFTCSCGDSYTEAIAKLAAHTWGEWKVTKAATYEAEGREERSCSVCKKTEGRAISKLEYKEIEIPATEEVKPLGEDAVLVLSDASVGEIIKNTKGNVSVTDKDGKAVSEKDSVASGMTVTLKDASGKVIDEKTIVVPGDNNGDGKITAADARTTLRASVSLDKLNTWQNSASNVDKTAENKITAADARFILRASVGLEKFSDWMKAVK